MRTSHTFAEPSRLVVAASLPSEDDATAVMRSEWPLWTMASNAGGPAASGGDAARLDEAPPHDSSNPIARLASRMSTPPVGVLRLLIVGRAIPKSTCAEPAFEGGGFVE